MPEHAEVQPMTSTTQAAGLTKQSNQKHKEEDWITVDEQFVHVDINGLYRDDVLEFCTSTTTEGEAGDTGEERSQFQLTGLETQEPILQIGRQVFAGTYSDSADTSVFFRCTAAEESTEDEVFSRVLSGLSAKLEWKTKKKLTFKRVFLKPVDHN